MKRIPASAVNCNSMSECQGVNSSTYNIFLFIAMSLYII